MASKENIYKRMNELAGSNKPVQKSNEPVKRTLVSFQRSNDGTALGIVKENHHYFIKKSFSKKDKLDESDFTYVNGTSNKTEHQYNSLSEAEKQRNFFIRNINEAWDQGGSFFGKEIVEGEKPSLDAKEDATSVIKRAITEGKSKNSVTKEENFKASLPKKEADAITNKKGLMPESADKAVKKALGLITEDEDEEANKNLVNKFHKDQGQDVNKMNAKAEAGEDLDENEDKEEEVNEDVKKADPFTEKGRKNQGDEVTADSKVKDSEVVSEKSGKESPEAPINDSNAKKEAEKATGTSKKDANKKPAASDSLAVNQATETLKESSEFPEVNKDSKADIANLHNPDKAFGSEEFRDADNLVTADSEIDSKSSPVNQTSATKEKPQAPINDSNAKSEAEKATGSGNGKETISNNTDEHKESDPFDDKEDAGDENGDIVTEDADKGDPFEGKPKGEGDESTADSDQKDSDRVDNETKVEKEQAPYNNHNQPDKGHKEEKGEELKPKASKKDIVAEQKENEAADILSKLTEGESKIYADSKNAKDSVNTKTSSMSFDQPKLEKGVSTAMDDNAIAEGEDEIEEAGEEEIASAADDMEALDAKADAEETPVEDPEMEAPVDDAAPDDAAPEVDADVDVDVDAPAPEGGEEAPAEEPAPEMDGDAEAAPEEGGEEVSGDLVVREIEKLVGKIGEKVRDANLEPSSAEGFLKSIISSFEDKLPDMDIEDRKEISDKILKAEDGGEEEGGENVDTGLEPDAASAIDSEIDNLGGEEGGEEVDVDVDVDAPAEEPAPEKEVEEDAPMQVNGEDKPEAGSPTFEGDCNECGTFEQYMESRGYSPDAMEECSMMEMANLVSGYAAAHDEGMNDGDFENIAKFANEDVLKEVEEYGHGEFAGKLKPFMGEGGVDFGMVEPTITAFDEDDGEDMDGDGDIDHVDYLAKKDHAIEKAMKNEDEEEDIETDVEMSGGIEGAVETPEEPTFAPPAETIAAGAPSREGKTKSVDVDLESGKVNVTMTEGDEKVRKYIQERLEVLAGKKKSSINENKKSDRLKKLDAMIEKQYNALKSK